MRGLRRRLRHSGDGGGWPRTPILKSPLTRRVLSGLTCGRNVSGCCVATWGGTGPEVLAGAAVYGECRWKLGTKGRRNGKDRILALMRLFSSMSKSEEVPPSSPVVFAHGRGEISQRPSMHRTRRALRRHSSSAGEHFGQVPDRVRQEHCGHGTQQ